MHFFTLTKKATKNFFFFFLNHSLLNMHKVPHWNFLLKLLICANYYIKVIQTTTTSLHTNSVTQTWNCDGIKMVWNPQIHFLNRWKTSQTCPLFRNTMVCLHACKISLPKKELDFRAEDSHHGMPVQTEQCVLPSGTTSSEGRAGQCSTSNQAYCSLMSFTL